MVHGRAASEEKDAEGLRRLRHEIFNEPPADRERVLDDLLGWLEVQGG